MVTFEITIAAETYRIMPFPHETNSYNVFNHSTFHVIQRKFTGRWEIVEHRFGKDDIPLTEIGEAIDQYENRSANG